MGDPTFAPIKKAEARVLAASKAAGIPVGAVLSDPDGFDDATNAGFGFIITERGENDGFAAMAARKHEAE
jgi:hypothetical protein